MAKQRVEVEGGEIAIKNKKGDLVIIPANLAYEVNGMIDDGCHGCVDALVSSLPNIDSYNKHTDK